jgi:hypothetical protein
MIWQLGGLPLDTHHNSVLAMLHCTDDNVGGTGLLVKLWSRDARNCNGHTGPTVYGSQAVSEWILSKGQAKPKCLFLVCNHSNRLIRRKPHRWRRSNLYSLDIKNNLFRFLTYNGPTAYYLIGHGVTAGACLHIPHQSHSPTTFSHIMYNGARLPSPPTNRRCFTR